MATSEERIKRELLITFIEHFTGPLLSMPYAKVSVADLCAIAQALQKESKS